jgi:hypothetical protein
MQRHQPFPSSSGGITRGSDRADGYSLKRRMTIIARLDGPLASGELLGLNSAGHGPRAVCNAPLEKSTRWASSPRASSQPSGSSRDV